MNKRVRENRTIRTDRTLQEEQGVNSQAQHVRESFPFGGARRERSATATFSFLLHYCRAVERQLSTDQVQVVNRPGTGCSSQAAPLFA